MTSSKPNKLTASHKRVAIEGTPDSRLILTAAIRQYLRRHLRRSAWFVQDEQPATDDDVPIAITEAIDNPVPPEAVAYLRLILSGLHMRALYEWLISVNAMGYNAQTEVMLLFLRWFQIAEEDDFVCGMPVVHLLGERGRVLLEAMIEAGADYHPDLPKNIYSRKSEREYEIAMQEIGKSLRRTEERLIAGYSLHGSTAEQLINMRVPWSGELTRLYLQGCWHSDRESLIRQMPNAAYCFSLSVEDDEIKTVYDVYINSKYDLTVRNLPVYSRPVDTARQIIRFRKRMIQAIERKDDP